MAVFEDYSFSQSCLHSLHFTKYVSLLGSGESLADRACNLKALKIALDYNFVTDITSLVLENTDLYQFKDVPHKETELDDYEDDNGQNAAIEGSEYVDETCRMRMYEFTHFRGKFVELISSVEDLASIDFDDQVASISVYDCCWTVYNEPNFSGMFQTLGPQDYKSAIDIKDIFKKASSVQMIHCD